jgi:hypothetical protein
MSKPVKGIKITTDKKLSNVVIHSLADYQAIVGGYIEAVDLHPAQGRPAGADGSTIFVNEEGKIHGLEFNSIASDLALPWLMPWDSIVGDVVVVGPVDGRGEMTDVTEWAARRVRLVASEAGGEWIE